MLRVRVVKKYHDAKGILIGYTIECVDTKERRNVYKDMLKQAVINKQCEVVNMTLTSDGRLIGKAAPAPKKRQPKEVGIKLIEVYTNGRNLVAGLIDRTAFDMQIHDAGKDYGLLAAHQSFDVGHELAENIKNNYYDNVRIVDGKPDMSKVRRKSFSKVRDKMINLLKGNNVNLSLRVEKAENKYEYHIIIDGYNSICNDEPLAQTLYALIIDSLITAKIKTLYIDEDSIVVNSLTGINDVRKAIKNIK